MDCMRRWIVLCETMAHDHDYYVHVSPIANLRSILQKGLTPPELYGNYTGYETSLNGTYVTYEPRLIHNHIYAREMEQGYILVLVQVANTDGVIDEDALHPWLIQCVEEIVGRNYGELERDIDDPIWKKVATLFKTRLGQPDETVLQDDPGIVEEFAEATVRSELYGEDGPDPDWWEYAKDLLVRAYPQLSHPVHGNRYSLRLPNVGYSGPTRIVAVITVENGRQKVVKGSIPAAAAGLIRACLRD